MNKKNFPIFISILITSIFFTMIFYFVYTNIQNNYKALRMFEFADASLDFSLSSNDIQKLKTINGIKIVGGVTEQQNSAMLNDSMLVLNFQDNGINEMREYSNLLVGRFARNENEIVLSRNVMLKNNLKLGDSVLLKEGQRYINDSEVNPTATYTAKENFKISNNAKYQIVGVYNKVYNKYLNINFALTVPKKSDMLQASLRFDDFKDAYKNREKIKNDIEKQLGYSVSLEFSKVLSHYYRVELVGLEAFYPILIYVISITSAVLLFIFFIRNIFRVWGFRKVKELSMFKSIGTTDFQIYLSLLKEAVLISILPILIGHVLGYFLMNFLYIKMQEIRMLNKIIPLEFSLLLSFFIIFISLFIVVIAVISPAKIIAKINIIEGIRGNFNSKNKKRKKSENLWKELRLNNMNSIKSLRYITAVGIIIISCFFITVGVSYYFRDFSAYESAYNINATYSSSEQETPKVLTEIMSILPHEKAYISRNKYFNISSDINFSDEVKENIVFEQFEDYLKNSNDKRIDGALIGLEESELEKLGGKKGEFLLLNIIQSDSKVPLSKAKYIKYLDNPSFLTIYLSGANPSKKIKIDKIINSTGQIEERLRPFEVAIFTDLETQKLLIENHDKAKEARAIFELKLKVNDSNLKDAKEYIEKTFKANSSFNDRFNITTGNEILENQDVDIKVFILLICGIGLIIFLLNITNGYSSINLSLYSRKREIGSLFSCGMEKTKLKQLYLNEFIVEEVKSLGITLIISLLVMFSISLLSSTFSMKLLLTHYPWFYFLIF